MTIVYQAESQINYSEINYSKIKQKKIQEYLHSQEEVKHTLLDIHPSLQKNAETEGYHTQTQEFFINGSLKDVWQHYLSTNPSDSWNSKNVSFAMLFSKKEKRVIYKDGYVSHLDTGQVVFLNLKLVKGLTNLASVFEFINIDTKSKVLEFSYVEGNTTQGKQQLQFIETGKGETQIIHTSYYKSNSVLRDLFLYPYFHNRLTSQFHRNMKKLYRMHEKSAEAILSSTIIDR